jgi:hypothetical protein
VWHDEALEKAQRCPLPAARCPLSRAVMETLEERRLLSVPTIIGPAEHFYFDTAPQGINYTFDENVLITDPAMQLTNLTTGDDASGWVTRTSTDDNEELNYRVDHTDQDGLAHVLDRGNYDAILNADRVHNENGISIGGDFSSSFFFQPGDFNHDRTVDQTDWSTMTNNVPIPSGATYSQGDVNYDGFVGDDEDALVRWYGTTLQPPPSAPNTLTASGGPNFIDLAWNAPADLTGVDGYGIWCSTDGGVSFQFVKLIDDGTRTSWRHLGLADGTKYMYQIRAHTPTGGYSLATNKAWAVTTLPGPTNPPTVSDIAVDHLTLTWDDNTTNEVGFNILVTDSNDQQTAIPAPAHAGTGKQSYTVNSLLPDTEYSFQVRSKTDAQVSAWSPAASAVIPSHTVDNALNAQIDAALVGHVPADVAMFTSMDHNTLSYVRNPNFWYKGDLTSVSVWQYGDQPFKMTAIDPEYVISCSHATDNRVDTMQAGGQWVGSDGVAYDRQVVASTRVLSPLADGSYIDLKVGKLNAPLPATVTPARILPAPWDQLFNGELHTDGYQSTTGNGLAIITLNQDTYAGVDQADYLTGGPSGDWRFQTHFGGPVNQTWAGFYIPRRTGDSGAPAILPFFGSTVLLGCWTSYTYGASVALNKNQINAAITSLGGDSSHWLKETPYPAGIIPNDTPFTNGYYGNPQPWNATATTPQDDIQDSNGIEAILYPGSAETLARSQFPLTTIEGIDLVTRVDVTGTVLSWSNSTDADGSLNLALTQSNGATLGASKMLLAMPAGWNGSSVPISASWSGLALTQPDLDDMTLDLLSQFYSSTTGTSFALFGNVTITLTYG